MNITIHPPAPESLPTSEFLSDTQLLITIYGEGMKVFKSLFVGKERDISFEIPEGKYDVLLADVQREVFVHGRISESASHIHLFWEDKWIIVTNGPGPIADITVTVKVGPNAQSKKVYLTGPQGTNYDPKDSEASWVVQQGGKHTMYVTVNGEKITAIHNNVLTTDGWNSVLCSDHTVEAATMGHVKVNVRVGKNLVNRQVTLIDPDNVPHILGYPADFVMTKDGPYTVYAEDGEEKIIVEKGITVATGWSPTICIKDKYP